MSQVLLTANSTPIFKYIVWILGKIINIIFEFLYLIHIPNVGIAIILFTIVVYSLMLPLTIKQQKFSKMSAKMNPEIQAIQKKYKGKRDQDSMLAMSQETKAVYAKYGVSPSGSCLQLLIQMPILFALYDVIRKMPAYVAKIKDCFTPFVNSLGPYPIEEGNEKISFFVNEFGKFKSGIKSPEKLIDFLNNANAGQWTKIREHYLDAANDVYYKLKDYNTFLGINISESPSAIMKSGVWWMIILAILIPVLAAFTQWVNIKLMPQPQQNNNADQNPMMSSMKTMNLVMPIMSAVFCFSLPAGMGIYWITSAVVRTVQQVAINKHINKMDIDEMIKNNIDKYNEKRKRAGLPPQQLTTTAKTTTKSVSSRPVKTDEERKEEIRKATEYYNKNYNKNGKQGSLTAKANMVKQYNEKNNKQSRLNDENDKK